LFWVILAILYVLARALNPDKPMSALGNRGPDLKLQLHTVPPDKHTCEKAPTASEQIKMTHRLCLKYLEVYTTYHAQKENMTWLVTSLSI